MKSMATKHEQKELIKSTAAIEELKKQFSEETAEVRAKVRNVRSALRDYCADNDVCVVLKHDENGQTVMRSKVGTSEKKEDLQGSVMEEAILESMQMSESRYLEKMEALRARMSGRKKRKRS